MPTYKLKGDAAFNTEVHLENVKFSGFSASTRCESKQHVFARNPYAAEYIPTHNFKKTNFENVEHDALAWIEKPDPFWAAIDPLTTPDNCGDWPCTGPENAVLKFQETTYSGGDLVDETTF